MDKACPKCASVRWMTEIHCETYVSITSPPGKRGWLGGGSGQTTSDLRASVCADCGYTELQAVSPNKLWWEWNKQNA